MQYRINSNMFEDGDNVRVITIEVTATDLADLGAKLQTVDLTDEASVAAHADMTVTRWVEPAGG